MVSLDLKKKSRVFFSNWFFLVEFATIRLVQSVIKYDQFKPEEIDALLKEQNVGATTTTTTTTTATQ